MFLERYLLYQYICKNSTLISYTFCNELSTLAYLDKTIRLRYDKLVHLKCYTKVQKKSAQV